MGAYKNYKKIQYSGNHNDWVNEERTKKLSSKELDGTVSLEDSHAEEFNNQFAQTGIKYVPVTDKKK